VDRFLVQGSAGKRSSGRRSKAGLARPRHDRREPQTSSPSGVNWNALSVAVEEPGLEFFAFDASYVEKLRAGDTHIEGHFVNYFSELIRLKLRSRLNTREAIEDVRQETFMRVLVLLRGEGGLRQPDRLGPFVNSVCNHVLLEHYRSKKKVEAAIDEETEATVAGKEPSALSLLETKDTERVVRQILHELSDREVCAELGISREYLRVLLHRAKQSFKSFYLSRLGPN
jgi:RNA polymerase sigma-70 factor (ECF subfamily)